MLQVLSVTFIAIGTTFKMVSFPADIDTKNTMSVHGFTLCIVVSGISTLVFGGLRFSPFGEKTVSVVDVHDISFITGRS